MGFDEDASMYSRTKRGGEEDGGGGGGKGGGKGEGKRKGRWMRMLVGKEGKGGEGGEVVK